MTDTLIARLRDATTGNLFADRVEAADRIEALQAELTEAAEVKTELQETITEMCNAIPDYDWSGGAANWITKVFAERDQLRAEVERLTAKAKDDEMLLQAAAHDVDSLEARLTALEGQKPFCTASINVEGKTKTVDLFLASGAAPQQAEPKEQTC